MSDANVSYYHEAPQLNDKDLQIWFAGFKEGKGLS